jgi:hypothetical protein
MLQIEQTLGWQQLLTILSNLPIESNLDLKVKLSQAIELFESQILNQSMDDLPDPIAGKMRSYVTESHRLLRLLQMAVMFIASARNPTTLNQRRQTYQRKLDLLLQYCQAVIGNS